ncbi:MAG TPA: citrate synthase [Methylomirabilota bacterium]|jgi:citrate synthase|nr:citrate synthase [Methylomirabilota bacterium]
MTTTVPNTGLEDVVVSTSEICFIDGNQGRLLYRGYDIHDLVAHSSFEETAYLLWHGTLPTRRELDRLTRDLTSQRRLPPKVTALLKGFPRKADAMDVVRTAVSALGMYDPEAADNSREANVRKAIRIQAQVPTLVAAWARLRKGKAPVAPNPRLNLAANFLYMLFGKKPSPLAAKAMDVALILHADHELNASTFAARVTVATLSDIYSGVVSGIGALKGPLHGGANVGVIRMLLDIGEVDRAEAWIKTALAQKKRIMGFGHRVYHTEDPRATHLRRLSEALGREVGELKWYEMSRIVERVVKEQKGLNPNVDFYSASTYYSMGIDPDLYTPIFVVSRVCGWTAHVLEQQGNNRLIRPRAEYTGSRQANWVPIDQR